MRLLDTHLHLIYLDRFDYRWLGNAPPLNRQWTVDDYFALAGPLGVEQALHMEVDVAEAQIEDETRFALGVDPRVIGAIANGRPESPDFPAQLEKLLALGPVRGIRRLLQNRPPEISQSPTFIENMNLLARFGLTFDICVKSHELALAENLAAACPDTQFVLDHCGNPKIAEGEWEPWAGQITKIAALPNTVCKVSGILANVNDDWTVAQLLPYVEHVISSFGWNRVVWGSDHPVVTLHADLARWITATREIVAGASADEQASLFHRNAERIYRT